jgi:hypothetical protein
MLIINIHTKSHQFDLIGIYSYSKTRNYLSIQILYKLAIAA